MPDYAEIPASAAPNGAIPNPVRPIVEHTGWGMPYRGFEAHGVNPNSSKPQDVPADLFDQAEAPAYEEKAPERVEVPVPVRIVQEGAKENKEWFSGQEVAGATASMIASRDERRTSLTVKNIGTVTVWIGPDNRVSKASGFPLAANDSQSFNGWGAVWAVSDDGTNQTLAVIGEYVVER